MLIFRWLYTFWGIFLFFCLMLLQVIVFGLASLLPRRQAVAVSIRYNNIFVTIWAFLMGMRYKVVGADKLNKQQAYIFAGNHTSTLDVMIINATIWQPFSPLAKKELKKIPLLGYIFSKVSVMVDRSSPESRRQSVDALKEVVKQNISILLFPEGTRNKTGQPPLLPFKSGAIRIALETDRPIIPLAIIGTRRLLPNDKPPLRGPGTMTCYVGDPIEVADIEMTDENIDALKNRVFNAIDRLLRDNDPDYIA
jgi:1-acyl-sn-glycerol-3-phosphate acyltransferase